jgi:hypothetical protein
MFQQAVDLAGMLRTEDGVLIDAAKRNIVEAQDRIAAVNQKPAPFVGQLTLETLRAAMPCAAMNGRRKWLALRFRDQPTAFVQTSHGRLSFTPRGRHDRCVR